jgi:uncharacterized cupredoxin-like copper-binding protein
MIWRIWFLLMLVLVGGVWLSAIPYSPQPILETGTVINLYRDMGMVPEAGEISFSKEIGHDVFEVPERDAVELEMAMASMGMAGMAGMEMSKDGDHAGAEMESMVGMEMNKDDDHTGAEMKDMAGMDMQEGGHAEEQGEAGHGEEAEEEGGHGGGSEAEGLIVLAQGTAAEVDREIEHDGIIIDSNAVIDMKEWSVGSGMTMAQAGQIIRLTVKNSGNLPHEFMIMNGAAMEAVSYRLNRPDWNLLEHRATMEIPFLMPGDSTDVVVKITKSGIWMYMCMFPYHMQLGMMGMLMTPDMMGQMDMNMEMDLFMPDI